MKVRATQRGGTAERGANPFDAEPVTTAATDPEASVSRGGASAEAPTVVDPVARAASAAVGGPLGRHAVVGAKGWRPAAAILSVLSTVLVAVGVLQKNHCVTTGWATPGSLWRACYSDLPVAVSAPAGSTPWSSTTTAAQPPLSALITWLVRLVVPDGSQLRLQQGMFAWSAAIIAALVALTVCCVAAALPRRPWSAAHVALAPVLVTSALISFDALAVLLVAAGLLAWQRSRFATAGGLLAAALLTRPTLGAVLVAALVFTVTRRRTHDAASLTAGAAFVGAVVLGIMALCGADVFASFTLWRHQAAGYGSLWNMVSYAGVTISPATLTALAALGWVLAAALAYLLARDPRMTLAPVAMLALVVVMVTSRALPVQAALWVLPLIAVCGIKWRDHLVWAASEFAYFLVVWGFIARASNMAKALTPGWYSLFVAVRLLALLWLAWACLDATMCRVDGRGRVVPSNSSDVTPEG